MREEDTVCVGSDGLQYCKVCGEAKEAFFPEGGFMGMKKHSRQCACDRKAYEEEQKYFKDKEHRELVSRNTSICFDESRMEEWTFENADMSDAVMHKAKNYVDNWEEMKRNHIGCLFWGPVGTQCHLDKDCFIVRNSYTADKHFVYLLYFYLITLLT